VALYIIVSFQIHYLNLFLHRDNSDGNFRTVMAALVQLEYWIRSKRNVRGYVSEFLSNS